jgi:hypothetical protein
MAGLPAAGNAYLKINDPRSALRAYDESLKLNPNNPALKDYTDKLRVALPPDLPEVTPVIPVSSAAGKSLRTSLYLFGGAGLPLSPSNFTDSRTIGYQGGFGFGLSLSPSFSVVFEAQGSHFPLNAANYPSLTLTGGEVNDALLLVNGKYGFLPQGQPFVPYGIFGLGLSLFTSNLLMAVDKNTQASGTTPAVSEAGFGYRLGLGFEVKTGEGMGLFMDASGLGTTGLYNMIYAQLRGGVKLDL